MGFAATSARLMMLTARASDIKFQLQQINQAELRLQDGMAAIFANGNFEPLTPAAQMQDMWQRQLQMKEKRIALIKEQITRQYEAITTEMGSLKSQLSKDIKEQFKILGDG